LIPTNITSRLEALPATNGFWRRITVLSLGGFFEFYDLFLAAYVAPGLVKSGILTTTTPGLFGTTGVAGFVASFFLGLFAGTALFGFVADRWAAHHLHRLAALVCRRLAGNGVPAGCIQPEPVALHLRRGIGSNR
jgi:MFS family permease